MRSDLLKIIEEQSEIIKKQSDMICGLINRLSQHIALEELEELYASQNLLKQEGNNNGL